MFNKKYTEEEIKKMLVESENKRNKAWHYIYFFWRDNYMASIKKRGGTIEEVDEIFSEIAIQFEDRLRNKHLPQIQEIKSYFCKCIFFAWIKNKKAQLTFIEPDINIVDTKNLNFMENSEIKLLLDQILKILGDKCKKVLNMFSEGYSMKEISIAMGISSDLKAKKIKYECQEKLRIIIEENSKLKSLLKSFLYE